MGLIMVQFQVYMDTDGKADMQLKLPDQAVKASAWIPELLKVLGGVMPQYSDSNAPTTSTTTTTSSSSKSSSSAHAKASDHKLNEHFLWQSLAQIGLEMCHGLCRTNRLPQQELLDHLSTPAAGE
jgi:hypothetical protein